MNELIALYALNFVIENTTDAKDKVFSVLSREDVELFADWAESTEDSGTDILDAILEIIVNKVNELKGI